MSNSCSLLYTAPFFTLQVCCAHFKNQGVQIGQINWTLCFRQTYFPSLVVNYVLQLDQIGSLTRWLQMYILERVDILKQYRNLRAAKWQTAQLGISINPQLKESVKLWRLAYRLVKNLAICSRMQPYAHVRRHLLTYMRAYAHVLGARD